MNNSIQVISKYALDGKTAERAQALRASALAAKLTLESGSGKGNDFLGWLHLPSSIDEQQFSAIEKSAAQLRSECEYVISIGIGGSYLGAKAVIEPSAIRWQAVTATRVLFPASSPKRICRSCPTVRRCRSF